MQLLYSPTSPFARKVLVCLHELELADEIKLRLTDPRLEGEWLAQYNPLGKVPALVIDARSTLFDSREICEFLDLMRGGRLIPSEGPERWRVLTNAALADGIAEAAVLVRNELTRPAEQQSKQWIERQLSKVRAGLARAETLTQGFGAGFCYDQIALGCTIGYLDLRLPGMALLGATPSLRNWTEQVFRRQAFTLTMP